jgi:hypothetical protein
MYQYAKEQNWRLHFLKLVTDLGFGTELSDVGKRIIGHCRVHRDLAPYRRRHLQTRFFETGDNFYLGMEFTREYEAWKMAAVDSLVKPLEVNAAAKALLETEPVTDKQKGAAKRRFKDLRGTLQRHLDR